MLFLYSFSINEGGVEKKVYIEKARLMKDNGRRTLEVDIKHLNIHSSNM